MSIGLIIVRVIFLIGGFSGRFGGYGYGYGHRGIGLIGIIVIVNGQAKHMTSGYRGETRNRGPAARLLKVRFQAEYVDLGTFYLSAPPAKPSVQRLLSSSSR